MTDTSDINSDTIIDLDPDQVVETGGQRAEDGAPASQKPSRSNRNGLYLGAALLLGMLGGGWLYRDVLSSYVPSDQMTALTEKVAALESSNASMREQLTSTEKLAAQLKSDVDSMEAKDTELSGFAEANQKAQVAASEKLTALEQALGETKSTVAELAARPAAPVTSKGAPVETAAALALLDQEVRLRLESLEKDVASLKVKPAEAADNRAELSQGLSDLKAKIAAGTGYRDEYERLNRMVPAAAGLDVLGRHAALGLPNAQGLAGELRGIIGYLPKPAVPVPAPENQSWWSGITDSLSDLITIKVEGDVDWPTTASAAAALAESGDVTQAIEQMSKIEGVKPGGVQQWIDRANNRLAVEVALKSVEDAVLRVIAAKG
jgi:hypothetical protein